MVDTEAEKTTNTQCTTPKVVTALICFVNLYLFSVELLLDLDDYVRMRAVEVEGLCSLCLSP